MVSLVIVESPAKAKTISRILGPTYEVKATYGHVRDLPETAKQIPARVKKQPWARLGVNVSSGFEPLYIVPEDKKKYLSRLKEALKEADQVLLATDEDREGESISWHVIEVLKPKVPVRRIAFHEITDDAIREAIEHPRDIDDNLVRAQESRRILDRLFGYQLSPVLWKKVRTGLSAGRVQSVAVRLCVMRERERRSFRSATFWDVEAQVQGEQGEPFAVRLTRAGGERLATGQDFLPDSGELKPGANALWVKSQQEAEALVDGWREPWRVTRVEEKPFTRKPAPPFTTSSLQQEANRKLGFSARHTMQAAQRLYEGVELDGERQGLITYMRTDSTTLSDKALHDAQAVIRGKYGEAYSDGPRRYVTRSKGAQEAHEAIRPTELSRTPEDVRPYVSADELRLYELIWKRTLASQMTDARLKRTALEITASGGSEGVFSAAGKTIEFPGFLRAYVEGSDDPTAEMADQEVLLPALAEGSTVAPRQVEPRGHETQPPARYTEASLVKKLEAEGIGRPSTYATILETIQDRGYVRKKSNALIPTFTAFAVTQLLEEHFADYVDIGFTARMEQKLDDIADGHLNWQRHLETFYFGNGPGEPGLEKRIETQEPEIEYPAFTLGPDPVTGAEVLVKVGRYGPYVQVEGADGDRRTASLPPDVAPADLTVEAALNILRSAEEGPRHLGEHPESGEAIFLARGRFGPYVQLGESPAQKGSAPKGAPKPKRASLPKGMSEDDIDLALAVRLLSLPRSLGHDEAGEEVVAAAGRFGPFLKRGSDTRSIPSGDDVYMITLERALQILAQPKKGRGQRGERKVLKELGKDAAGLTVQLVDGRFGPYLTNGELNASLPRGTDPEALTPEAAAELLATRGKAPQRGRKGSAQRKA